MKRQQCRYCTQAVAQTEDEAWCDHLHQMIGRRATSTNCEGYEFCKIDAFYGFRGLEATDPRAWYKPRKPKQVDDRQITWKEVMEE